MTNIPKPRCKLGQMCWVKNAQMQANIGRIVYTEKYLGYIEQGSTTNEQNSPITDHYWNVSSNAELVTVSQKVAMLVSLPDSWLTPMLPDEDALKYVLRNEEQPESVVEYAKELITTEGDIGG